MRLLQCGFIASGASQHKNSKDICRCTPVPVGCSEYTEPCPGGWGFALALEQNGDLYCWGVNQPTMLQKKGLAKLRDQDVDRLSIYVFSSMI